jgi:hypothetical protein
VAERRGSERSNSSESPRLGWAGSGASANTHMGVSYVRTVRGRKRGHSLRCRTVKMRMEERERETGTVIISSDCLSIEYTVHYLNTWTRSAYTLVGQSANIPKLRLHHTSHTRAFLVARRTCWSRGVPRRLNCLSSQNRGCASLVAGTH